MADGIADGTLGELADNLAVDENLPKLGLNLGFRQNKVDLYMRTNKKNDTSEGTSTMLFTWKKKTRKSEQISSLVKALIASELVSFAEEIFPAEVKRQISGGQVEDPTATSTANVKSEIAGDQPSAATSVANMASANMMDRIVSDKELLTLAKILPANSSTELAIHLGVSFTENDNIRRENPSSLKDGHFKMLMKWKCKKDGGKIGDLDRALDAADCGGLKYKDS